MSNIRDFGAVGDAKTDDTAAICWKGAGSGNMIAHSRLGTGTKGAILVPEHVKLSGNLLDG